MSQAVTKIDTKPPTFQTLKYMKKIDIVHAAQRMREMDLQNKQILKKINIINRNTGVVDTFNPLTYVSLSNWRMKELELIKISKTNRRIHDRLINMKSYYPLEEHKQFYQKMTKKMEYSQKYPHYQITNKDDELKQQPSISHGLVVAKDVIRPRCFLEFQLQVTEFQMMLGRIVIELYSDIVPKTTDNFLAICKEQDKLTFKNCPVHKIFKDQYLVTGDITEGNGKGGACIYEENFEPENFDLKHSKSGVLSMVTIDKNVNSQFCITFKSMPQFDGKQVVFGRVVKGADNLYKVNDCGRKFGKPVMKITIAKCGEVKKGKRA